MAHVDCIPVAHVNCIPVAHVDCTHVITTLLPYNRIPCNPYKITPNKTISDCILRTHPLVSQRQSLKVLAFGGIKQLISIHLTKIGVLRKNIQLVENDEFDCAFSIHSNNGINCLFGNALDIFNKPNIGCVYDIVTLDATGRLSKSIFELMKLLIKYKYINHNTYIASAFDRHHAMVHHIENLKCSMNMFKKWANIKLVDIVDEINKIKEVREVIKLSCNISKLKQSQLTQNTYFWQLKIKKLKF